MSRPRVYKTEAIVLKHTNLGEADRILTLYTPNFGKLRAVAKGVRKPKSKLGGHVELLTRSAMMFAHGRNLDIVTQSQTIDSFLPLRNDLWKTSCAFYLAELVDSFTEEQDENYPLYRLLLDALHWLENADAGLSLRYFEIHLLDHSGYRPQLLWCARCTGPLEPVTNLFSADAGGVLCPMCGHGDPFARPVSVNTLKVMRFFQSSDYASSRRLRIDPELSVELEQVIRYYLRYLLEREVKSVEFLDLLRQHDLRAEA